MEVALGKKRQMVKQNLHRRIEAVAFAQLDGQALGQVSGSHSCRVELLHNAKNRHHQRRCGTETLGQVIEVLRKVTGLVDSIDERVTNHPLDRVPDRQRQLICEVILKRDPRRDIGLKIGGLAI